MDNSSSSIVLKSCSDVMIESINQKILPKIVSWLNENKQVNITIEELTTAIKNPPNQLKLNLHKTLRMATTEAEKNLVNAVENNDINTVKKILKMGIDPNIIITERNRWAIISYSAKHKHNEILKLLIENNADIDVKDLFGTTPLSVACFNGSVETVKILLQAKAKINIIDNSGYTALYGTAFNGNIKIARMLIQAGANVNIAGSNEDNWTALIEACDHGHIEIVKLLLQSGADVNIHAIQVGEREITTALHAGVKKSIKIVKLLLQARANLHIKNEDGDTAFMLAVQYGKNKVVNLLLQKGVDLNIKNEYRKTALHNASLFNRFYILNKLIEAGVDTNTLDDYGKTALHNACFIGVDVAINFDIIDCLSDLLLY